MTDESASHRLILLRHAQATAAVTRQPDHDRALTRRGVIEATAIAEQLAALTPIDLIVASSALRTVQTAQIVRRGLTDQATPRLVTLRSLYLAEREELVEQLAAAASGYQSVLLVGHNPGLSTLACWLAPAIAPASLATASALITSLNIAAWIDLSPRSLRDARYEEPRTIEGLIE